MRRPSYANVTATIALVVALCGGAYAAGIGRNDVKSKNIAPKAVKSSDLASKAVKTKKIGNDAVTGDKVSEATLGTVPNADALDGLDSSAFVRGSGRTYAVSGTDEEGGDPSAPIPLDIGGTFRLECRSPASASSDFRYTNTTAGPIDVWTERKQTGTLPADVLNFTVLPVGATASVGISGPVVSEGQSRARFTIADGSRVTQIDARVVNNGTGCRFPLLITELGG